MKQGNDYAQPAIIMDDLLSQRRRETPARAAHQTHLGKKRYEAFDTKGRPSPYLEIRCVQRPSQALQSRYLLDVVYRADVENGFMLLYSFMAVEVKGANLKEVRRVIQNGQCEFIQEFHDDEFAQPLPTEPMITSTHFITGEKLDDILSTYGERKEQ